MHLRSSLKIAILTGILTSSAFAEAPKKIIVFNNTAFSSTVRVTSGQLSGKCVGDKLWSKAGESKEIAWNSIKMMCYGQFPCSAEIYVGDDHDCGDKAGSKDAKAGSVTLAENGVISVASQSEGHILFGGQATLTVNQ